MHEIFCVMHETYMINGAVVIPDVSFIVDCPVVSAEVVGLIVLVAVVLTVVNSVVVSFVVSAVVVDWLKIVVVIASVADV